MKHFLFKTTIALLCFGLGILSSYFPSALSFREMLNAYPLFSYNEYNQPVDENVKIKYQELIANESGRVMKFVIENQSTESFQYESYGKDNHCNYTFYYKTENAEQVSKPLACFSNGLSEQKLLPNETATYLIDVPAEVYAAGKVIIAFEFTVGEDHHKEIIWTEEMLLPRIELKESPIASIVKI